MQRDHSIPEGGSTGHSHEHSEAIAEAARWLASASPAERDRPAVVLLRHRFGLTAQQACQAITEAALMRARAL